MSCKFPFRLMSCAVCLSMALAVFCSTASAQYPTQDDAAKEAYQEAKQLFEDEKYEAAAARFREAYELKPSWKILYNIGQSDAAAKNHGLALEAFEMFLSEGGDDIYTDRREQVIAEVDRLRRMVGYVQVKAPKGAIIYINEIERGTAPILMALPVSAGVRHEIYARYNGQNLEKQQFRVVGAQKVFVEFAAPASNASPEIAPPQIEDDAPGADAADSTETTGDPESFSADSPPTKPNSSKRKANRMRRTGWILTGVGAGTLIVGGVLGGVTLKKNNDLVEECGDYCPDKKNEEQKNLKMANVTTGLLIGGGAIAAAGTVLLIIGTKREKQLAKGITVYPAISRDTVGAGLEWRF